MPFGAVVSGDIEGLKLKDELKIALAGPLLNLGIGLLFVAVWWLYPESYAFTDVVADANFSMALVNFLPIYPLDGGRVLYVLLALSMDKEKADVVCKILGGLLGIGLLATFIASIFFTINLSLLFFSLFVIFGTFGKGKDNKYVKIFSSVTESALRRGMPILEQAVSVNTTVKRLVAILDCTAINRVEVYSGKDKVATLSQKKIEEIVEKGELYSPISKYL
jgi:stage IV sporulation protein FB